MQPPASSSISSDSGIGSYQKNPNYSPFPISSPGSQTCSINSPSEPVFSPNSKIDLFENLPVSIKFPTTTIEACNSKRHIDLFPAKRVCFESQALEKQGNSIFMMKDRKYFALVQKNPWYIKEKILSYNASPFTLYSYFIKNPKLTLRQLEILTQKGYTMNDPLEIYALYSSIHTLSKEIQDKDKDKRLDRLIQSIKNKNRTQITQHSLRTSDILTVTDIYSQKNNWSLSDYTEIIKLMKNAYLQPLISQSDIDLTYFTNIIIALSYNTALNMNFFGVEDTSISSFDEYLRWLYQLEDRINKKKQLYG